MEARIVWENLCTALSELNDPSGGDYELKLATASAGVELLFTFPPEEILRQVQNSTLPPRAVVSWLLYEAARLPAVDPAAVEELRRRYEATAAPGEGVIPAPRPEGGSARRVRAAPTAGRA
jgi:hypothetical protein